MDPRGSPTTGSLSTVAVGPFESRYQSIVESRYQSIAGTWWANTLFMLGLFTIGVAPILGVAVRSPCSPGRYCRS